MTLPPARMLPYAAMFGGLVIAVLMLFVPVRASFADDPVLRFQGFDRQRSFLPTEVDCGPAPANVGEPAGTGSIYDIARDDACHRVGYRRFWLAIAVAATFLAGGLVALAATEQEL